MTEQQNLEAVRRVCLGNQDAVQFLCDITEVLHFWDDLVDRDQKLSDEAINKAMWKALIDLPRNRFYINNFVTLNGVLINAIINWNVATQMERVPASPNDAVIAFIIRSSYIDLVTAVAVIVGGPDHAARIMLEARRVWHDEGLDGYQVNLAKERLLREGA